MADFRGLLEAVESVCRGAGSGRVVDDVPSLGAYPSPAPQEAARSVAGPRAEVWIKSIARPSSGSWCELAAVKQLVVTVAIRIEITPSTHELDETGRRDARDRVWSLAERIRRALQWPGQLVTAPSGAATHLVSGCLGDHVSTQLEREDWRGRRLSVVSEYRGLLVMPAPVEDT